MPESVTATYCQEPVASAEVPLICCSPPLPEVVMAKRTTLPEPESRRKEHLTLVPVPKSKMRDHVESVSILTQAAMVKSLSVLTTPVGREAYPPVRFRALPLTPAPNAAAPESVASFPLPEASASVVPEVALAGYQTAWLMSVALA